MKILCFTEFRTGIICLNFLLLKQKHTLYIAHLKIDYIDSNDYMLNVNLFIHETSFIALSMKYRLNMHIEVKYREIMLGST